MQLIRELLSSVVVVWSEKLILNVGLGRYTHSSLVVNQTSPTRVGRRVSGIGLTPLTKQRSLYDLVKMPEPGSANYRFRMAASRIMSGGLASLVAGVSGAGPAVPEALPPEPELASAKPVSLLFLVVGNNASAQPRKVPIVHGDVAKFMCLAWERVGARACPSS